MDEGVGVPGSRPPAPWETDTFRPPPLGQPEPAESWPVELSSRRALPTTLRAILGATFDAYAADAVPILALSALTAAVSVAYALVPQLAIVQLVVWPVATATAVAVAGERLRTGSVSPRRAVAAGLRRAFWVFVWSFLVGLAIAGLALIGALGALLMFGIASSAGGAAGALVGGIGLGVVVAVAVAFGLFLLARWSLAVPVIVLNLEGPLSGSRHSAELVRGRTARLAVLVVLSGIVVYAPAGVVFLPALLARGDAAAAAVVGALSALTWPVLPIAFTVAYARLERVAVEPPHPRPRLAPVLAVAVGGVVALSLVVGAVGASALVGDLSYVAQDRGAVLFGTASDLDRCRVSGAKDRFGVGETIALVAILERTLPAGEEITLTILRDGAWIGAASQSFPSPGDCIGGSFTPADIAMAGGPGRYRLEYRAGDELQASGGFEIVLPPGSGSKPSASARPASAAPTVGPTGSPSPTAAGPGTVLFGTGPVSGACRVTGAAASFATGQPVYVAADLGRAVPPGEEVRIAVRYGGGEIAADTTTVVEATACLVGSLPTTGLPPGRYTVEYAVGGEILASGEFELIP